MFKEFKAFILRGNVVDLAIAVVIGAAFSAVVNSLVTDVITPLILKPAMDSMEVEELAGLSWNGVLYGKFLATILHLIIVAFSLFLVIKGLNRVQRLKKRKKEEAPAEEPAPTKDQEILMEIRDLLKK